jgi:putative transposase
MKRSKFSDEQILAIVREGEAGRKVADLCRTHGITEQTYYRWKAKYGGMELSEMVLGDLARNRVLIRQHVDSVEHEMMDCRRTGLRTYAVSGTAASIDRYAGSVPARGRPPQSRSG